MADPRAMPCSWLEHKLGALVGFPIPTRLDRVLCGHRR